MLQLFDQDITRTDVVLVRGAKTTIHEISSDQWHEYIAIYDEEENERREQLEGKALAGELLEYNQRLVACSLMPNHPDASFEEVFQTVKTLGNEPLSKLAQAVKKLNDLDFEGNAPAADSGTD